MMSSWCLFGCLCCIHIHGVLICWIHKCSVPHYCHILPSTQSITSGRRGCSIPNLFHTQKRVSPSFSALGVPSQHIYPHLIITNMLYEKAIAQSPVSKTVQYKEWFNTHSPWQLNLLTFIDRSNRCNLCQELWAVNIDKWPTYTKHMPHCPVEHVFNQLYNILQWITT